MGTFGYRIKKLRESRGLTQKELAVQVGIREATLSRYENDKRTSQWEIIVKLAEELNTSADHLLGITEDMTPIKVLLEVYNYSDVQKEFLKTFERLNDQNKQLVMERTLTLYDVSKPVDKE